MRFAYFALLFLAAAHANLMMESERNPSNISPSIKSKKAMAIDFMQNMVKHHAVPGFALSVVYNNQTVIAQGFGLKQYGNSSSFVTADTLFQIGSYSKTFIALGIAKLVDEGALAWNDSVKTHLPLFELQDKYAEEYTTIADLLSMNSVYGDYEGDSALILEVVPTEREVVQSLAYLNTTRKLRSGYAYANANYEILGQVLEHKSNMTWGAYLYATFFKPLGMHHTYSQALDVPNTDDLSFGHNICNGKVAGPCNLKTSPEIFLRRNNSYMLSGSILSSAADLSKFSQFLLNKGQGIFKSKEIISSMITGQTITTLGPMPSAMSLSYSSDGNTVAAGYGFDIVGDVMYGNHYFDKGGDTEAFKTRNGFIPDEGLAIVLLSNARPKDGAIDDLFLQDRMRSYILGIFLGMPKVELQETYDAAVKVATAISPAQACDAHFFDGKPWDEIGHTIPKENLTNLVGTYTATTSTKYYGNITITIENSQPVLSYGAFAAPIYYASNDTTTSFLWASEVSMGSFSSLEIIQTQVNTNIIWNGIGFIKLP